MSGSDKLVVLPASLIKFRPLTIRAEGADFVVGRIETGVFVAIPAAGMRALALLRDGRSVAQAAHTLNAESGAPYAVTEFVAGLDEMGFVAAVDDRPRPDTAAPASSMAWLRPHHVSWILRATTGWIVLAVITAGLIAAIADPMLRPRYADLAWGQHAGIAIAGNALIAWLLVGLHESAHLLTARAAGSPGRIMLGTRLQFLAAQTDVSGIWAAPRRIRMIVYLAGMTTDVLVYAICALVLALAPMHGLSHRLVAATGTAAVLALAPQFMVFMRTDLYFVVQDLSGCANLFADAVGLLREFAGTVTSRLRIADAPPVSAEPDRPMYSRRVVRWYAVLLVAGTVGSLGVEATVGVPAVWTLARRAVGEFIHGRLVDRIDGSAALITILAGAGLWAYAWWQSRRRAATT